MFKRLFWFTLGVVAGIFGVRYAKDKARNAADEFSVGDLVTDVFGLVVKFVTYVVDVVREALAKNDAARSLRCPAPCPVPGP